VYDYHTHNRRCGHAEGVLEEYVQSAIQKGLRHIGLSDHSPIYHLGDDPHPRPGIAMHRDELTHYLDECVELKRAYRGKIDVRVGIESDYVSGWDDHYRALWEDDRLDYVIGSVHWIGDWQIFKPELPEGHTVETIFSAYLDSIKGAAQSGIYDIMGHIDAIKVRGYIPDGDIVAAYKETLEAIAASGVAIELNTSGWRKSCADQFPSRAILESARTMGIPVCLGSDAHAPNLVGAGFAEALDVLREVGYTQIATFERREMRLIPLSEVA